MFFFLQFDLKLGELMIPERNYAADTNLRVLIICGYKGRPEARQPPVTEGCTHVPVLAPISAEKGERKRFF